MNVNVSIFENAYGGRPKTVPLKSVIDGIRSGHYADQIKNLRALLAAGDRAGYDRDKKCLPAFTISGTCSDRKTMASHRGIRDNKQTTTHQAASVKHVRPML
jgi:hypothetical protein